MSFSAPCRVPPAFFGGSGGPALPVRAPMTRAGAESDREERARQDRRLMQRMAGGDEAALADLYDRFSRPLYSMTLQIVSNSGDAEDIVHDVFVALWKRAGAFEPARGTVFSWVVTLARNRAIDHVRARRRHAEILGSRLPSELGAAGHAAPAGGERAALDEEARSVRAALAQLPSDQRQAVELAFFAGLTQGEIAERVNAPLGTIKARIRRGLLKLRDRLSPR